MSGIPEFRRGGGEGPRQPPLRRAAGVIGLVAGILMMLGYVLLAVTVFAIIGLLIALAGSPKPSLVMVGAVAADVGLMAFVIGIYSLMAGLRGRREHPGRVAASLTSVWAVLLMVAYALAITAVALEGGGGVRAYTPLIMGVIGSALALVAAFLVRPGASFGAWVTGSSLGLAGLIMLIISKHIGGAAIMAPQTMAPGTISDIATLTYTPILIGGAIAAAALIIAPFIGSTRTWISEIIAAAGAIIAAASLAYISATNIQPLYRIYELSSIAHGDIADLTKIIGITGTAALTLITAATTIGTIALIIAIIYLITTQKQAIPQPAPPPPSPPS